MVSCLRKSNKARTAVCSVHGSSLSPTIPPKRLQPPDPVLRADLFPLFAASREILNRYLHNAAAAGEDLRRDLVVELETGRLQIELFEQLTRKEFERSHRVGEISSRAYQCRNAEASSAQIRRPRLLRIFTAE